MLGMSWYKRLGFNSPCKCAYTIEAMPIGTVRARAAKTADMEEWERWF
jgi:hypothetical protein